MTRLGFFCLSAAAVSYGAMHVIDKAVMNAGGDAAAYTVLRVFIAAGFIGLGCLSAEPSSVRAVFHRKNLPSLIVIGVLASGIGLFFQIKGLTLSSATNVSVLLSFVAPVTSFFAYFIIGEPVTKRLIAASLLMLAGIACIYAKNSYSPFSAGDLLVIAAIVGYGYSNVLARQTMRSMPTTIVTFGRLLFGSLSLVFCLPFLSASFSALAVAPGLVLLGGFVFALRMLTYYRGIELEGASVAATFLLFSPVVAVLAAHFFLGEPLTPMIICGIALTFCGGAVLSSGKKI